MRCDNVTKCVGKSLNPFDSHESHWIFYLLFYKDPAPYNFLKPFDSKTNEFDFGVFECIVASSMWFLNLFFFLMFYLVENDCDREKNSMQDHHN
jgi:hypothetical protein